MILEFIKTYYIGWIFAFCNGLACYFLAYFLVKRNFRWKGRKLDEYEKNLDNYAYQVINYGKIIKELGNILTTMIDEQSKNSCPLCTKHRLEKLARFKHEHKL
jgi:hypothetical protein